MAYKKRGEKGAEGEEKICENGEKPVDFSPDYATIKLHNTLGKKECCYR